MIFLMVECPTTGQVASARIEEGIERLPKTGTRSRCPLCSREHFWTSRNVRFAESADRQPRIDVAKAYPFTKGSIL